MKTHGESIWILDQEIEQFSKSLCRLSADLDQPRMAINIFEKELFELLFIGREGMGQVQSPPAPLDFGGVPALEGFEDAFGLFEQVAHLQFDEGMHEELAPALRLRLVQGHHLPGSLNQGQAGKLPPVEQSELEGIVDIVCVVGDAIGGIDHLDFEHRSVCLVFVAPKLLAGENLARQVEAGIIRISLFKASYQVERKLIVGKPSLCLERFLERILPAVSIGWMADIVQQREGLDQIFVEAQGPSDGSGQRCNFMRVGQSRSVVIPHVPGEDLHLATQTPKRRTVKDPIAIPLEGPSIPMLRLVVLPSRRVDRVHGEGCKQMTFPLLPWVDRNLIGRLLHRVAG